MFKRVIAMALVLVLAVSLVPAANAFGRDPLVPESVDLCCHTIREEALSPDYFRPAFEGKLIDITPQRVADTFVYLDEHYVKNHPEQALSFYTGTEEDRENLKKLAETITAGCKTNKAKADAIANWIKYNIYYDVNTSAYASDTFYRREGNCLSYANLMMFLLRSLGIPAVVGDGWRGNMKEMGAELFDMEGHAWIFVRLNNEWVLYDPLWLSESTTDRDYMAEWIYFDTVEFVTPVCDGNDLPPKSNEVPMPFWTNGKYYLYSNAFPEGSGTLSYFVNNQAYIFVSNQCDPEGSQDGRLYLDGRDKSNMVKGELYRDGWVSYGEYHNDKSMAHAYAFPNGMMPDGYTMEFDGKLWYMSYDAAMPILMKESDYWIQDGLISVKPGFSGPCLGLRWQDGCLNSSYGEMFLTCENLTPDVATMDIHGNVNAISEGYAEFRLLLQRREREGNVTLMGSTLTQIFVSNEDRTPDFRDLSSHVHDLKFSHKVQATCLNGGADIYKCSGCTYTEERNATAPLGHNLKTEVTKSTCVAEGLSRQNCTRCAYTVEETLAIDPEGHAWEGTECTLCGDTRLTPFNDVQEESFYEEPVAWAVAGGITNGVSATDFGSLKNCNRAQVVTFLWRAAGQPEPKSMNNPFVDVQAGSFYEKPVLWAVENGITNGTDATHFGPNGDCNRASVVTFLWRAAGKPAPSNKNLPFVDVPGNSWYAEPVLWALEKGITNGTDATHFGSNSTCIRAQVVTFLYRAFAE